ncbi:MAG TPA: histidine phosphatase family protein [Xanthobacteraceae bacterium]|nr:histidine phosphatase family protein [Xanthobacteraceae bacterium]
MPVLYYVRHGETDFNLEGRLQGRLDTELNAHGRRQAAECGMLLHELFARDQRQARELAYLSSPLTRARQTMEVLRATLGLDPFEYDIDERLVEIAYGNWEGLTLPEIEAQTMGVLAERDRDKWDFAPPAGESYRQVASRIGDWHASLTRDTVVAAHGGGVRVLMALLDILPEEEATHAPIEQGVVYVFADGTMSRYA